MPQLYPLTHAASQRISHASNEVSSIELAATRAVLTAGGAAPTATGSRITPQRPRHLAVHPYAQLAAIAPMAAAVNDGLDPVLRPHRAQPRFGVWARALAAADFSALVLFGSASTLPAADAAFAPVCLVFLLATFLCPFSQSSWHEKARRAN